MKATAPRASTVMPALHPRPRRPYRALGALALLVGVIVFAASWIYLGPRAVPSTYFTVTFPPDAQGSFVGQWNIPADTREGVRLHVEGFGGEWRADVPPSITGPFTTYGRSDPQQTGDAIRIGGAAALIAYLLLGLLGFSARFRRLELRLGDAGAAFGRQLGATRRAKAWSLHLVAAGAIASGLVSIAMYSALEASSREAALDAGYAPYWVTAAGPLALFAVISTGVVAALAIFVRRGRISQGVGPFLVGYGGLLAALWVLTFPLVGASCVDQPGWAADDVLATPAACVVGIAAYIVSDGSAALALGLWTLLCAIPAVGALLVYRDYQRRRATPSERPLTNAAA